MLPIIGFLLVVAAVVFFSSAFIVEEGKQVVVTQFKRPVKFIDEPGLRFKMPFIQSVEYFEKKDPSLGRRAREHANQGHDAYLR